MATVTGMTAAAMLAIRDNTIVSAAFDSSNHLILTKYDESTVDAGSVQDSTVTAKGLVELATTAETTTGTDTARAVTPSGLAAVKALLLPLVGGAMSGAVGFTRTAVSDILLSALIGGDTFDRYRLYTDGKEERGPGSGARDANWYRSAVGVMKTDTAMLVGTSLGVGTDLSVTGNINSSTNVNTSAWTAYTPVWSSTGTAVALGNGTVVGRYQRVGRTIHFAIEFTAGSTTTFGSGVYNWTVPFTAANNGITMVGSAEGLIANPFVGTCVLSPNVNTLSAWFPNGTGSSIAASSGPIIGGGTFASGHKIRLCGTYEAAS